MMYFVYTGYSASRVLAETPYGYTNTNLICTNEGWVWMLRGGTWYVSSKRWTCSDRVGIRKFWKLMSNTFYVELSNGMVLSFDPVSDEQVDLMKTFG